MVYVVINVTMVSEGYVTSVHSLMCYQVLSGESMLLVSICYDL